MTGCCVGSVACIILTLGRTEAEVVVVLVDEKSLVVVVVAAMSDLMGRLLLVTTNADTFIRRHDNIMADKNVTSIPDRMRDFVYMDMEVEINN